MIFLIWATMCVSKVYTSPRFHVSNMLSGLEKYSERYRVPRLPYKYDAFEPWINAKTMEAHHKQVAEERVFQLNRVLKDWRSSGVNATLAKMPIFGLIQNIDKVPVKWREDLRNSIGGYLNHIFYFVTMSPNKKGIERNITEVMRSVLMRSFINQSNFEVMFNKTSLELFSNGYVWLVRVPNKRYLTVYTSHTEMNPISFGMQPLLGIDLWEHAYWSKYGNNKEEYIRSWWKLVDFDKVEQVLNWWWSFDPYDPKHHDVPDYEYDEL